jgi:Secretion system C-terminal sorting domain
MKEFILSILCIILFVNLGFAQNKYDAIWTMGFYPSFLYFDNDSVRFKPLKSNFFAYPYGFTLSSQSSICNPKNGKLAFCTSSYRIFTDSMQIMKNGDSMVSPKMYYNWNDGYFCQGSVIIPKNENEYYVVINGLSDSMFYLYTNHLALAIDELNYSIVDMSRENGKGAVTKKRIPLMQNARLSNWATTACRHGNGRDWWLVKNHVMNDEFYTWRFTSDSIYGPYVQTLVGDSVLPFSNRGQGEFNKDATMYAQGAEFYHKVQLNYFDRCSGLMTRYKVINVPIDTVWNDNNPTGLSFSANGRFLYVCTNYHLWQYDLQEEDSAKAWYYVMGKDTINGINKFYFYSQLKRGPNDKIYVGSWNGTYPAHLTYIDAPDQKGADCGLCKRCLNPNNYSTNGLPNMFNYRLGTWQGSVCDTIWPVHTSWLLYPNPTFGQFKINVPNSKQGGIVQVVLYNILGQKISEQELVVNVNYEIELSIGKHLPKAMYIVKARNGVDEFVGKVMKE